MVLLWFIAGVLVGVATSRVGLPLWRSAAMIGASARRAFARAPGRMRYLLAGVLVASFALAAGILYLAIGSRQVPEPPGKRTAAPADTAANAPSGMAAPAKSPAKSMDAEVAGLEARLARDGGTPGDWSLLAQAYEFMGRPDDAKRARAKAGNPV